MSPLATVLIAMKDLADAEHAYRTAYELHGADDIRTGRAWDLMRRAGARARVLHHTHAGAIPARDLTSQEA